VVLALLAGGAFFMLKGGGPVLESVTPDRAKIGQTLVLSGRGFGATPSVLFGERKATLVSASPTRIEAQVPLFPVLPGRDSKVDVAVEVGGRKTTPVSVAVYQGPRLDGLSPDVALPGEEIELAGAGWQSQPVVRFGQVPGEVLSESPTAIRVRVPPLDTAPGSRVEVVVESGGEQSNVAPFLIGKLPIVSRVDPQAVGAGDTVTVTGRGFRPKAADNLVKVGAVRALVSQATESELRFVVPWTESPGEAPLEIHVKGIENVGRGTLTVNPPGGDVVDLHFVPEPLPVDDTPDHDHAVLSIELGPVFVLTATQGRSAAERAVEAARALNGAVGAVKASLEADFALDPPRLLLAGRPETLLEATPEDAQAYGEDWTHAGARNRGGSPGRLSVWWNAVARDLVLLLIRSQKPQYAVALAPEGRLFVDIFQAARKTGGFGVPRTVLHDMKPPVVEQMRSVALRLPASVPEPSAGTVGGPPGAGPGGPAATLQLQGVWRGTEVVRGERNYLTFTFRPKYSTAQMGSGLTVDIVGLQVGKDGVRFSLPGNRYYSGTWDGQKISGTVSSDAAGKDPIGTFELVSGQ
jgi:hypothetical protein